MDGKIYFLIQWTHCKKIKNRIIIHQNSTKLSGLCSLGQDCNRRIEKEKGNIFDYIIYYIEELNPK